jgi:hypothetical protein
VSFLLLYVCCHFCRCLIACSPDVQSRLHAELDAAGLTTPAFEAADVAALPYLGNVIKEAMRVNPTVPQVNRWVQNGDVVPRTAQQIVQIIVLRGVSCCQSDHDVHTQSSHASLC